MTTPDYGAIYDQELARIKDASGNLPLEVGRLGYSRLDQLVRELLSEQGERFFTAGQYQEALREVLSELTTPGRVGSLRAYNEPPDPGSLRLHILAEGRLAQRGAEIEPATGKLVYEKEEYLQALEAELGVEPGVLINGPGSRLTTTGRLATQVGQAPRKRERAVRERSASSASS